MKAYQMSRQKSQAQTNMDLQNTACVLDPVEKQMRSRMSHNCPMVMSSSLKLNILIPDPNHEI